MELDPISIADDHWMMRDKKNALKADSWQISR
jgi:hypothetical protein